jgi:hypothetical protein
VVEVAAKELDVLRWSLCRIALEGCDRGESLLEQVRETLEDARGQADGRPLAVRLVLEGTTPLHGNLHENAVHWHEEFRAVAASLGDVWLEKVLCHTRKEELPAVGGADDSPLAALRQSVENLQFASSRLLDLIPGFEQLRSKLPPDLLSDDDPFTPGEEELAALREDVKELLAAKMQQGGRHAH